MLTDFQNFCTVGNRMKFATKHTWHSVYLADGASVPPHRR